MKKISVIIPVYNGEKYLPRCIDSVLKQKNFDTNDLDVLFLNDGSNDGSSEILQQYQGKHTKIIRVINQHNIGVARTRNKGIKLSIGEYIIFLDQDDFIDPDYCQVFYNAIKDSDADVVSGGYRRPDSRGKIRGKIIPKTDTEYSKYILMAAWAKIHKTDFLRKNKIEFFDNKFGEDNVFTVKEIANTKRWRQINYTGYNWFYNEESVSNTSQKGLRKGDNILLLLLLRNLANTNEAGQNTPLFQYYMLRTAVGYLLFSGRKATVKRFMKVYEEIFTWLELNFKNIYRNQYLPIGPRGETLSARLAIFTLIILHKLRLVKLFALVYCKG